MALEEMFANGDGIATTPQHTNSVYSRAVTNDENSKARVSSR